MINRNIKLPVKSWFLLYLYCVPPRITENSDEYYTKRGSRQSLFGVAMEASCRALMSDMVEPDGQIEVEVEFETLHQIADLELLLMEVHAEAKRNTLVRLSCSDCR